MTNPIDKIYTFNEEAGFLGKGFDSFAETAYVIEEAMEGFEGAFNGDNKAGEPVKPGDPEWTTARQFALSLMNQMLVSFQQRPSLEMPDDVAELDKAIDGCVFNIGKMAKMGLSREQIAEAFDAVAECNLACSLSSGPAGWTGPEDKLQAILNNRGVQVDESIAG